VKQGVSRNFENWRMGLGGGQSINLNHLPLRWNRLTQRAQNKILGGIPESFIQTIGHIHPGTRVERVCKYKWGTG